jgi:glycosyltransferase involved in cell wall biosynthesis
MEPTRQDAGATSPGVRPDPRPLVTLLVPAFNEAGILDENLKTLCNHMRGLEAEYRSEILVIDDGSTDNTGKIAEAMARTDSRVRVLHHNQNYGLGQALKFGFRQSRGDYVVVLDVDLSYSPDHVDRMLARLRATDAKVVIASPYLEGGAIANVPAWRRLLSQGANAFLSFFARERYRQLIPRGRLSTLTGMVRAYDGPFLRRLRLRSLGAEINPEIVYKAMLLRSRIEEIPARLDWELQRRAGGKRQSSLKTLRQMMSVLLAGFVFRPFMFLILPGLALVALSFLADAWILERAWGDYLQGGSQVSFSHALGDIYQRTPHAFLIAGFALLAGIQLGGLGVLALQSKKYFEELFYLVSRPAQPGREELAAPSPCSTSRFPSA